MIKVYCYLCGKHFYVRIIWFLRNYLHIKKCFRSNRRDYICEECIIEGNKEAGLDENGNKL